MLTVSVNSVISVWLKHAAKKSVLSVRSVSHNNIRIVLPYSTYYVNKYNLCSSACQVLAPGSCCTRYGIGSFAYLCHLGPTFLSARKDFAKLSVSEGKFARYFPFAKESCYICTNINIYWWNFRLTDLFVNLSTCLLIPPTCKPYNSKGVQSLYCTPLLRN